MALEVHKARGGFGGFDGWYVACPDCGVEQECEDRAEALELAGSMDRCTDCARALREADWDTEDALRPMGETVVVIEPALTPEAGWRRPAVAYVPPADHLAPPAY